MPRLSPNITVERSNDNIDSVRAAYRTGIEDVESALGSSSQVVMQLKQRLAEILVQSGDFVEARHLYSDVKKAMEKSREALPDFPSTWNTGSFEARRAWDYKRKKALEENTERILESQRDLADLHGVGVDYMTAEQIQATEVVPGMQKTIGTEHLKTAAATESLVITYIRQERLREAEGHAKQILDQRRDYLGPTHHLTLQSRVILASIHGLAQSCGKVRPGISFFIFLFIKIPERKITGRRQPLMRRRVRKANSGRRERKGSTVAGKEARAYSSA